MKKIALTVAALALSAGAAFAENPNVGIPADLYSNDQTPIAAPVAIQTLFQGNATYTDGSANGFGDHAPQSHNG